LHFCQHKNQRQKMQKSYQANAQRHTTKKNETNRQKKGLQLTGVPMYPVSAH
jgi:hypothetical protein